MNCFAMVANQHFYYRKGREGGGQQVMIGIIIEENVYNYGRPLSMEKSILGPYCVDLTTCMKLSRTMIFMNM